VKAKVSIILIAAVFAALCGAYALAQTGNGHAEPPDTGGIFTDVPKDHWAYDDLAYLAERGIITGLPGGKYNGDPLLGRRDDRPGDPLHAEQPGERHPG